MAVSIGPNCPRLRTTPDSSASTTSSPSDRTTPMRSISVRSRFTNPLDGGRKGGLNDYSAHPPVTTNSWTVLGCCQTLPNPFRKGLDMHGDIHDIVFAPYGSFFPDPSQVQIVFVATDGGITRGRFDSDGVVTWEPLSKGLAIGQSLAIGLDPNDPTVSVSGFWHNGNAMLLPTLQQTLPFGGGDGATARVDAGVFAVY